LKDGCAGIYQKKNIVVDPVTLMDFGVINSPMFIKYLHMLVEV
jgi:hypothetical protein